MRNVHVEFKSIKVVPTAGLEPAQVAPLAPQASASTNFATSAIIITNSSALTSAERKPAQAPMRALARASSPLALPLALPLA